MRLIDADALWMDVIHRFDYCDDFLEMLENAPTANVREVVLCKDCVNHVDERCVIANHHTSDKEDCMSVFGAKKRGEQDG